MKIVLRKMLWILGTMGPLSAIAALYFAVLLAETWAYWFYPIAVYGLIPVLDKWVGVDLSNRTADQEKLLNCSTLYALGLYSYLPVLLSLIAYGAWIIATQDVSLLAALGIASTVGMSTGVGFINSHELVHRRTSMDKWLAKIVQAPTLYGHHFSVYHTKFHHRHVATPDDPTSARFGESYWRYLPRAVVGGVRAAWKVETEQYRSKRGLIGNLAKNECVHAWGLSVAFVAVFCFVFGWIVIPYLIYQAVYAILLLEGVNYMQHYGLLRKQENGRYEKCGPQHSWDSNHLIVSLYIYQLQRHADHHANPGRRYPVLRYHKETPQLPASYVTMVFLALIPPLWFRVMNPRVLQLSGHDMSRINVAPHLSVVQA